MQTFLSIPGLYCVSADHIRFVLRLYCVNAVVSTSLLSPYCVLVRSRAHYDFFLNVQNWATSTKNIKIASRHYRFLLRSFYIVQVHTASHRFYIDVVGTWSSVTGFLEFYGAANDSNIIERKGGRGRERWLKRQQILDFILSTTPT